MANKDFSILKWLIFPAVTIGLTIGIAIFNVRTFGWAGSFLYLIALGVVNAISFVMIHFTGFTKRPVRFSAYIFEGLLILALLINVSYSLSAQRDLSLVAQAGESHEKQLEQVSKLKSGRAQAAAIGQLSNVVDIRTAFGQFDAVLFWVMVSELGLSLGGLFTVYGLAAIRPGSRRMPRGSFYGPQSVRVASEPEKPSIGFLDRLKSNRGQINANGSISEAERNPTAALRITGQASGVRVREGGKYVGHISWFDYLEGVGNPKKPTETEIKSLLERRQ